MKLFLSTLLPVGALITACLSVWPTKTQVPQTGWLVNNKIYFSHFWRMGSPRSRCQLWRLMKTHSLVHSLLAGSSLVESELTRVSFVRAFIPFVSALPSWPNHLPRLHLQIPFHWWSGFNMWVWWEWKDGAHQHSVRSRICSFLSILHFCFHHNIYTIFNFFIYFLFTNGIREMNFHNGTLFSEDRGLS